LKNKLTNLLNAAFAVLSREGIFFSFELSYSYLCCQLFVSF